MTQFPKLALGTWLMGGTKDPDPENDDSKDSAAIKLAIENGVTLIDTAQNYANGRCEEIIGEAVAALPRDSFQILTKQNKERLSYQNVLEDFAASQKRLGVDVIDYFLCHAPNTQFDIKDFFRVTNKLYAQGKIRNVGVSNFGPNMLKIAVKISETPIIVNQVHFALDDDDVLSTGTYDFCREHNITVQAYRTLVDLEVNRPALKILDDIARTRRITRQQVAIAYINSYEGLTFTIKASSKEHWGAVKEALGIILETEEIVMLRNSHKGLKGSLRHFLEI